LRANFDGSDVDFIVSDIQLFEATLPIRSAYALLKRFTDGQWSAADIAHVLSFALHGPSKEATFAWRFQRDAARHGMPSPTRVPYVAHPDVARIVNAAPGDYAELAASILTEALFGKEANDAA